MPTSQSIPAVGAGVSTAGQLQHLGHCPSPAPTSLRSISPQTGHSSTHWRCKRSARRQQRKRCSKCRSPAAAILQGHGGIYSSRRGRPAHRQGCMDHTQPRVRLSVRPGPPRVAPGQAGGAVSGGARGCEWKRHTRGGGGGDKGQEAPRLYTSICMPNPLPGSGASGPPSARQLTSLAGWFPSRHRAEVGVEQRGEKGGCSQPHAPSRVGRLGSLEGSCPLPELVGSTQGAGRGVGGGGG